MSQPGSLDRGIDFAGIREQFPIAETIGRYLELKRRGGELLARCPFHNDSNPSFSVVPRKGKAFCNACHWAGDVIDFIAEYESCTIAEAARRLTGDQLPATRPALPELPPDEAEDWTPVLPAPATAPAYDPARTYNPRRGREVNWKRALTRQDPYRDAAGRILGYVVRMDIDGQKLTPTVTWARHRDGREAWVSGRFPEPRPLQGLDALADRPQAAVLVVSGEKCREVAARTLPGFVVVTWAGGDGAVAKSSWEPLHGRRVTLWPDADQSGWDACQRLAARLYGHAAEVRVIDSRGQAKGWDIADAVADGWTREQITDWVRPRISVWEPEPDPGFDPDGEPEPELDEGPSVTPESCGIVADVVPPISAASNPSWRNHAYDDPADLPVPGPEPPRGTDLSTTVDPACDDLPDKYSEDNVALAFSAKYADDFRYVAPWGRWMRWQDQRWVQDETILVFDEVRKLCRAAVAYAQKDVELTPSKKAAVAQRFGSSSTVAAVERFARADRRHAATVAQWDADPWLLNTPAGVVDLRNGNVTAGSRQAYMTKITHVAPGGSCPTWYRFLEVATNRDVELISFLQRMAGYALTGSTRDHALFFVYGPGGNGKGTFLNTLQWIMGDYAKAAPADMFTERKHEAHTTELARLMGARLVAAQETEEGKRWAEAKIKALTGGDPVTARFMRQDDFEFLPQFKLIMTGNHKPGLRNVDEAIKRRLHLIPFTVTIRPEDRDPTLPEKLRAEAAGILRWAIEGALQWQQQGLRPPTAVLAATDEYLEQQDVLGLWMDEACETDITVSTRRGDLYKSFKTWAEGAGEYVLPQKRWVAAMEMRGVESHLKDGIQMIRGVKVKRQKPSGGDDRQVDTDWPL